MDFREIDSGFIRLGMKEFIRLVMIFPVLIAEFKLGGSCFPDGEFRGVKLIKSLDAMMAVIVAAFIDSDLSADLPLKKSVVAIRAEVFGLIVFAEPLV